MAGIQEDGLFYATESRKWPHELHQCWCDVATAQLCTTLCTSLQTMQGYCLVSLLQPLLYPANSFDCVSIDINDPLPCTTDGNIVVALDRLNQYAEQQLSLRYDVAYFIVHHFVLQQSAPWELISGHGCAFLSKVLQALLAASTM